MLTTLALAFLTVYALWIFYLAVMNLKRANDAGKLSKPAKFFGTPCPRDGLCLQPSIHRPVP